MADLALPILMVLFFLVAVIYSSAGFGGGSSYLALLALSSIDFGMIRTTALLCNVIVVFGTVVRWSYQNKWNRNKVFKNAELLLLSIPLAYLAGSFRLEETFFYMLLGVTLIIVSVVMLLINQVKKEHVKEFNTKFSLRNITVGGLLGGLAGMVGIGGGIFLSPYLHLTNWNTAKNITITTSVFILINSIAGLSGQLINQSYAVNWSFAVPLMISVFIGGQLGNIIKVKLFSDKAIRIVTALVILVAGINVLRKVIQA